jgi:hypothetical protein
MNKNNSNNETNTVLELKPMQDFVESEYIISRSFQGTVGDW